MLSDYPAVATIPATDMDRATTWYRDKLGFEPVVRHPRVR
jgi:catechol 2,3-dioxygenase-like lactoylglutathione lyase family enzyme